MRYRQRVGGGGVLSPNVAWGRADTLGYKYRRRGGQALVGGPSGPMLLFQGEATWTKSIGLEGPPTRTSFRRPRRCRGRPRRAGATRRRSPRTPAAAGARPR
ncbi:DUF6053 domain-containing protein [Lysobacter enzymogenes]|uniref:DUF6053 domain-containing protein n=1 Tax=Lysobacter enzymogenes TaxID=69 RepID=UPI003D18C8B5